MLYLIADERGRAKIGYSSDPRGRLSCLQVGCADRLVLIGILDGDEADEARLQAKFAHLALRGEWFTLDQAIADEFHPRLGSTVPRVLSGRAGRR